MESRLLIVSPVRNEAAHLERVALAVAGQEVLPARWVLVDDSSTDDTLGLLQALSSQLPFIHVVRSGGPDLVAGPDRLARAAAPRGFNRGLAAVDWRHYSHIMKLDGDIELPPHYLRLLLERFESDPKLGIAGGLLDEPTPGGGMRRLRIPNYHVHGALKCYSRQCFQAIGGMQERLGWDTVDETSARMRGYSTVSFSDLVSIHHRPLASADGVLRGRARHGECAYISHYPADWVILRGFKVALSPPRGVSGAAFVFGYIRAAVRRTPRVEEPGYRRFARRELRARMAHALARRRFVPSSGG